MIIKLYKSNVSIGIILIPLFALILGSSVFFKELNEVSYDFPWKQNFFAWLQEHSIINFICSVLILVLNSVIVFQVFSRINVFSKTTYIPSLLYIGFLSFTKFQGLDFGLVSDALILLVIDQLVKIDQNKTAIHVAFKAGILIGAAFCFLPSNIILIFVVLLSLNLIRPFVWREWVLVFLGCGLPIVFILSSQFYFLDNIDLLPEFRMYSFVGQFQLFDYISIVLFLLFLLVGFGPLRTFFSHNTTLVKNRISVLFYLLLITIVITIVSFLLFNQIGTGLVVPLALLYSISSVTIKSDSFISLLLTIILIVNITFLFIG
jgi:hypothetical protein